MPKEVKEKDKLLNHKETEDLFRITFRNYNHLISVADSKSALLIRVSSIITSVMLAFGITKTERYPWIFWPVIILLVTSTATILLAVLASRPRHSSLDKDVSQQFFFGSFDLTDPRFKKVDWPSFYSQINSLFGGHRQLLFVEACKELFNVRKVLSRKFTYLSVAYWVFISGLLLSILLFAICLRTE